MMKIKSLHKATKESNLKWIYPDKADICMVDSTEVFRCDLIEDWDVLNQIMKDILSNHTQTPRTAILILLNYSKFIEYQVSSFSW